MKRFLALVLAVASLAACEDDPSGPPGATSFQLSPLSSQFALTGSAIPVTVTALDRSGRRMKGVQVTFSADRNGTVTPAAAVTDTAGEARATWTLGSDVAQIYALTVTVDGVAESQRYQVKAQVRPTLVLTPATLTRARSSTGADVLEAMITNEENVGLVAQAPTWAVLDPGVIRLEEPQIPGTLRGQRRIIRPEAAGTARVSATITINGVTVADTSVVTITP